MEILKAVAGEENKSYAFSLDMLANLYRSLGQYEKAEPLSVTAVEILKKQLAFKQNDSKEYHHFTTIENLRNYMLLWVSMRRQNHYPKR